MNIHLQMLEAGAGRVRAVRWTRRKGPRRSSFVRFPCTTCCAAAAVDPVDFLDRADALQALGKTVLLSRCAEFHRIAAFLNRYTSKPIGIILSIGLLNELFKPKWSENLRRRLVGIVRAAVQGRRHAPCVSVEKPSQRRTGHRRKRFCAPDGLRASLSAFHRQRTDPGDSLRGRIRCLAYTGRDVCRMINAGDETLAWTWFPRWPGPWPSATPGSGFPDPWPQAPSSPFLVPRRCEGVLSRSKSEPQYMQRNLLRGNDR